MNKGEKKLNFCHPLVRLRVERNKFFVILDNNSTKHCYTTLDEEHFK